jgi:predicted RecA/RadA family phage recombinase
LITVDWSKSPKNKNRRPAVFFYLRAAKAAFTLRRMNMAKNYYQDGTTMDWNNGTGTDVLSGQAVAVGNITGVAHGDIAAGEDGVLHMTGVFILPKVADETWPRGTKLYLDDTGLVTAVEPDADGVVAGTAWITNNAGEAETRVRLGF